MAMKLINQILKLFRKPILPHTPKPPLYCVDCFWLDKDPHKPVQDWRCHHPQSVCTDDKAELVASNTPPVPPVFLMARSMRGKHFPCGAGAELFAPISLREYYTPRGGAQK